MPILTNPLRRKYMKDTVNQNNDKKSSMIDELKKEWIVDIPNSNNNETEIIVEEDIQPTKWKLQNPEYKEWNMKQTLAPNISMDKLQQQIDIMKQKISEWWTIPQEYKPTKITWETQFDIQTWKNIEMWIRYTKLTRQEELSIFEFIRNKYPNLSKEEKYKKSDSIANKLMNSKTIEQKQPTIKTQTEQQEQSKQWFWEYIWQEAIQFSKEIWKRWVEVASVAPKIAWNILSLATKVPDYIAWTDVWWKIKQAWKDLQKTMLETVWENPDMWQAKATEFVTELVPIIWVSKLTQLPALETLVSKSSTLANFVKEYPKLAPKLYEMMKVAGEWWLMTQVSEITSEWELATPTETIVWWLSDVVLSPFKILKAVDPQQKSRDIKNIANMIFQPTPKQVKLWEATDARNAIDEMISKGKLDDIRFFDDITNKIPKYKNELYEPLKKWLEKAQKNSGKTGFKNETVLELLEVMNKNINKMEIEPKWLKEKLNNFIKKYNKEWLTLNEMTELKWLSNDFFRWWTETQWETTWLTKDIFRERYNEVKKFIEDTASANWFKDVKQINQSYSNLMDLDYLMNEQIAKSESQIARLWDVIKWKEAKILKNMWYNVQYTLINIARSIEKSNPTKEQIEQMLPDIIQILKDKWLKESQVPTIYDIIRWWAIKSIVESDIWE